MKIKCNAESLLRDTGYCTASAVTFFKNDTEYAALCNKCAQSERFWIELGGFKKITKEEYVVAKVMRV